MKIPNKAFSLVVYCCSTYYKVFHVGREGDSGGDTALFPCYSIADARLWRHAAARSAGATMLPDARGPERQPCILCTVSLRCTGNVGWDRSIMVSYSDPMRGKQQGLGTKLSHAKNRGRSSCACAWPPQHNPDRWGADYSHPTLVVKQLILMT